MWLDTKVVFHRMNNAPLKTTKKSNPTWLQASLYFNLATANDTYVKKSPFVWKYVLLFLNRGYLRRPVQTSPALQLWVSWRKVLWGLKMQPKQGLEDKVPSSKRLPSLDGKSREACGAEGWQKPTAQAAFSAAKSAQFVLISDGKREMPSGTSKFSTLHWGYLFMMYGGMEYIYVILYLPINPHKAS